MSKTILLFPGQGSQYVGMNVPYKNFSGYRNIMDQASTILGKDIEKLMYEGPTEELNQTENTQPALFVASMLGMEFLKEKESQFHVVAGHSLGEYSALCAAGVFKFEEALSLVKLRGSLMAQAGEKSPGSMSAILGMEGTAIEGVLQGMNSGGHLVIANYNSPSQTVISGESSQVESAEKALLEAGAKKAVRLPVSGAFHSPLMDFAVAGLTEAVNNLEFRDPSVPLIQNTTGTPQSDKNKIKSALLAQITSPVRWVETIKSALAFGCDTGIEVGPGKVLMGLGRAISRDLKITPIESMDI